MMEAEDDDPDSNKPVAKRARQNLSGDRHDYFTSNETVHLPHNNNGTGGGGDRAEENHHHLQQAPMASRRASYAGSSGGTDYGMLELLFLRSGLLFGGDISLLHQCRRHLLGPEGVSSTQQALPLNVARQQGRWWIPNAGCPFKIVPNQQAMSATSTMAAPFPAMTTPPFAMTALSALSALTNLNNSFLGRYLEGQQSGSQMFGVRQLAPQDLITMIYGGSHLASLKDREAVTLPNTAVATLPNIVQEGVRQTPNVDRTPETALAFEAFPVSIEEDDEEGISEYQNTLRKQIEFFEASSVDLAARAQGRNVPIRRRQVGIRCLHCKNIPAGHRPRGAVYFPQKLESLYQAAQNMSTNHFQIAVCKSAPESTLLTLCELKRNKKRSGGNGGCCKRCWVESAKKLGIVDAPVTGLEYRKPKAQHPTQS